MEFMRLTFAGKLFEIHCTGPLGDALAFIYHHSICHDLSAPVDARISFGTDGMVNIDSQHPLESIPRSFYTANLSDQITTLTTLMLKLVAELEPGFLILHGNVLLMESGKKLIIAGKSGSGKTTLSRHLITRGYASSWCEDLIFINTLDGLIHPHPRAFGCRDSDDPGIQNFDGKNWCPHPGITSNQRTRFNEIDETLFVVLDSDQKKKSENSEKTGVTWTTKLTETSRQKLTSEISPYSIIDDYQDSHRLTWKSPPDQEQRVREEKMLADLGLLILATSDRETEISDQFERPDRPSIIEMESAQVLEKVAPHLITPTINYARVPEGLRLFRLAGAFGNASWYNLTPGGTPDETIDLFMKTVFS